MTREEQIIETAKFIYSPSSGIPQSLPMRVGFIEGAKWADRTMIDKASSYIEMSIFKYMPFVDEELKKMIINKFKQEMEE